MVRVCDAIMGSGKTSAAITYMNEHPDRKFIFVTPYLTEANRITTSCPELRFVQPSNRIPEYRFRKVEHTAALIRSGRNIATTHQAFKGYTKEMLSLIRSWEYTLIIDENVSILDEVKYGLEDIKILERSGELKRVNDEYVLGDAQYRGEVFAEMFDMLRARQMHLYTGSEGKPVVYWTLPADLITAFRDVYVLTYLFEGQSLYYLFDICDIPFEKIGVTLENDGRYAFSDNKIYVPPYVSTLSEHIHIVDSEKLNAVGDRESALSVTWFRNKSAGDEQIVRLKNNLYNYFHNIVGGSGQDERLWGSFKCGFQKVRGAGYTKAFLPFNAKATNEYRGRRYLAYAANVYVNLEEKMFIRSCGAEIDDDMYALSVMIQWIWRSAIRDGQDIELYLPSRRMRRLLTRWMEGLTKMEGGIGNDESLLNAV